MKATGIVRRIDDLGRVVIPKEIRRTLKIREGEPMEIFTEAGGSVIFKKYSPAGEQSAIAGNLCEALYRTCARPVVICDRDSVIAISGGARRELLEKPISSQLAEIMDSRAAYRHAGGNELPVTQSDSKYRVSVAAPVISEGDLMGSVLFVSERNGANGTELEYKLAQTAACFLGKQMES